MRRQSTEQRTQGTRPRPRDEMRGSSIKRSRLRRLTLEGLEPRTLLATLPAPLVSAQATVSTTNGNDSNNSSPLIAIDPLNSQEMVAVYTNRNTSSGSVRITAEASFSLNGGRTWSNLSLPGPRLDPTVTTNPPPLNQYAEGVGFDRNNNLYIGLLEDNGGDSGGFAFVEKYNAASLPSAPTTNLVYAWNQSATNEQDQPAIIDFSMAVDDNVASFTDPTTHETQSDPNSGAVYVAMTINSPMPSGAPTPYNPYTIFVEGSADGVTWASATGGSFGREVSEGNFGFQNYADPRIAVSQGTAVGTDGGLVSVIYDDYGSGSHDGSNLDDIHYAGLTYGSGPASAPTSETDTIIAETSVRGAQTGSNFPLSTPSSPIGIGPGAVVAVDNTLGSFSTFQGRIYVAYVDRYTTTHDPGFDDFNNPVNNPSDNTDIFLTFSDDGGQTWSTPAQVNDDAGTTDGHSGAVDPDDGESSDDAVFNDGRPQYEPQIAVDPVTGTVAMSWLDVRDDPSLDRYADYLTTSIDGGSTFSSQTIQSTELTPAQTANGVAIQQPFADKPDLVTDAITGDKIDVGPYSGDESGTNPTSETSLSFGTVQGLAIFDGSIHPVWATTFEDGLGNNNNPGNVNEQLTIQTATATVAGGPRVISGTMGVVAPTTVDNTTFNDVTAPDGTDELTGFVVTFDRPVSVTSFTASDVHVFFNGTSALTNAPVAVGTPTPLDSDFDGAEATTFFVPLQVPQSAVGTYSYTIGPGVSDLMRTTSSSGDAMDQNSNAKPGQTSDVFVDPAPLSGTSLQAPFNETTEPLIIPGPHVVSTSVPGGVADPGSLDTTDTTLMTNGTVSTLDVTFDRLMNSSTFTPAEVLSMMGPDGPIAGPFTVTPIPATVGGQTADVTTFAIGFPTQTISGTYQVVLGSGITSESGAKMDANENAGLDLLFDRSTPGDTTTTTTYPGASVTIPAGSVAAPSTVTSTITVNDSYTITALELGLDITYPNDPDLSVTLSFTPTSTGVAGAPISLFTNIGNVAGSKANFTSTLFTNATTFNGQAVTPIDDGAPAFTGLFNPEQPFTPLIGGQVQGTYTLTITNRGTSTGTLNDWSLDITKTNADSGLGEPVADQTTASFRIFTMAPTNSQSSNTWTAVGPASENNTDDAGDVTAIAVDPSDPSGNTVYVGGGSGGIWKTTDYLTNNPNGPTYVPLIPESLYGSLDISSIAIFPQNNNPAQSVIIAGTGSQTNGYDSNDPNRGVGFLISYNGGTTWTLLDSTTNYTGNINLAGTEVPEPLSAAVGAKTVRDDAFVGTMINKVLVDPHPQPNGALIFYAAVSGTNTAGVNEGGIWKSVDGGETWQNLNLPGNATDIAFDPNSGVVNTVSNPTGNLDVLYAAFGTGGTTASGIYISPNRGQTWTPMSGGVGDPLIQEDQFVNTPVPVANNPGNPSGSRIVLAKPALTGNALEDEQYETWLYAAVIGPGQFGGSFIGLYVTKDDGQNWTKALIPSAAFAAATTDGNPNEVVPTNNPGDPQYSIARQPGLASISIAVDPNDPMVVYLGGTFSNQNPTDMIRVDISRLSDPYSLYTSTQTLGGQTLEETTSPASIFSPTALEGDGFAFSNTLFYLEPDPLFDPFINLLRNPSDPFQADAAFFVADTAGVANDGSGAWWTPFDGLLAGTTDVNVLVAEVDPLTGKTRLLAGDEQGTFTGVDDGTGTLLTEVGGADGGRALPTGSRNGNLQIAQFYNGATQPSDPAGTLGNASAATTAGALFYGASAANGDPVSTANILTTGDLNWSSEDDFGYGTDVATDQTGTDETGIGSGFYSMHPGGDDSASPRNFFQVGNVEATAVGRTFGLIQTTSGTGLTGDPQWPDNPSTNFAVNPIDANDIVIGSFAGRLFGTEDGGGIWSVIAQPANLDSTIIPALAYGAPAPGNGGSLNNYILAGTEGGNIFVTFTGGGSSSGNAWTKISTGLDGSPVEQIVTDPTRGTFDAFAITQFGVYYNADTAAANTKWVSVTGNLFKLTVNAFGDSNLTEQQLQTLDALSVDWRYVIPDSKSDPNFTAGATHPVVYVAGQGGVFQTLDDGATWSAFPNASNTTVPQGNMPVADVTDLSMELGNVDPTTGHPNVATGSNVLLATTYGSGDYAIHLSPIVFNTAANPLKFTQSSTGTLTFTGLSEQSAFGNTVTVTIEDVTNPADPIPLGAGQTDAFGNFSITGNYPAAPANNPFLFDGSRKIEVFATDSTGNTGNPVTFQITNNLPTPTAGPVFVNANNSAPPLTNGVVSAGTVITTSTAASPALNFEYTVPNPGPGQPIGVILVRVDNQQNATPVASTTLTGTSSGNPLTGFLKDPGPVPVGAYTYEYQYVVSIDGQPANSPFSPTTAVQVVAPMAAPNLYFQDDSGVVGDGITKVTRPRFTGTAIPNATNDQNLDLELIETAYTSNITGTPVALATPVVLNSPLSVDPVNGQYLLQPATALADGVYTLAVVVKDAAGDIIASAPTTPPTLTISTQGPQIVPTIALLPASDLPPNNPNATVVRRPIVYGNTDPGAVVTIYGSINGGAKIQLATATAQVYANNGHPAGYYAAQLPSNLNDGKVTLYAQASNAAGNTNPTYGTFTLQIFSVPGDYTGVGEAGVAIYSPSTGNYTFAHAVTGGLTIVYGFGLANVDIPVPGDYNGDGQTDPAIYRPTNGYWAIDVNSQAAGQFLLFVPPIIPPAADVIPAPADFDTDGQTDPAVYSIVPYNGANLGVFTILHNLVSSTSTSSLQSLPWGLAGDMPVAGDYDGSGSAQAAVYRPTTGAWYIRSSGVGGGAGTAAGGQEAPIFVTAVHAGDVPDPANYDGIINSTTKVEELQEAIYRPSTETFYIYNPVTKTTRTVTMPQIPGQGPNDVIIPASADFTGDGKADAAIYDQTLGTYEYINSATNQVLTHHFTLTSGDIPLTAPESYRAAASASAGAQAAFQKAGVVLAVAPASSTGSATPAAAAAGTGSAAAAVVVGATVPTGLTSTGKASTLPPVPVPTPAPIVLVTTGSSVTRPAQDDATDAAIASLVG